jgi:hypothetical protein
MTQMLKQKKITGYNGPTGAYIAMAGRIVPLTDAGGFIALTDSALLAGLGASEKAAEYAEIAGNHGAVAR